MHVNMYVLLGFHKGVWAGLPTEDDDWRSSDASPLGCRPPTREGQLRQQTFASIHRALHGSPRRDPPLKDGRPPVARRQHGRPYIHASVQDGECCRSRPISPHRPEQTLCLRRVCACREGRRGRHHFLCARSAIVHPGPGEGHTSREHIVSGWALCQTATSMGRRVRGSASPCGARSVVRSVRTARRGAPGA